MYGEHGFADRVFDRVHAWQNSPLSSVLAVCINQRRRTTLRLWLAMGAETKLRKGRLHVSKKGINRKRRSKSRVVLGVLVFTILSGIFLAPSLMHQGKPSSMADMAKAAELPEWLKPYPAQTQEAYAYAATHQEVLKFMSCYCGCENHGDANNADCYINGTDPDGKLRWDSHAAT